ncbi:OmpA family protein [Acuticoccus sediminis]|nr:OmpA family protein [Acuticoccus sediminis]
MPEQAPAAGPQAEALAAPPVAEQQTQAAREQAVAPIEQTPPAAEPAAMPVEQAEATPEAAPAAAPESTAPSTEAENEAVTETADGFDPDAGKPVDTDVATAAAPDPADAGDQDEDVEVGRDDGPEGIVEADGDEIPEMAMDEVDMVIHEMPSMSAAEMESVLTPGTSVDYGRTEYLRNIYRTPTMMRPDIAEEMHHDPRSPRVARTFILNTNHSQVIPLPFETGEYALTPEAMIELDVLADALAAPGVEGERYLIGGHTDTTGEADYNHWLSEKRAHAVRAFLIMEHNIAPERLVAVGFGEDYPLNAVDGTDPVNRRIEVTLIEDPSARSMAPLAEVPIAPGYGLDDFAYTASIAPLYDMHPQPMMPMGYNPVCATARGYYDSRPPRHNLDDFGGYRTPVACDPREGHQ